MRDAQSSSIEIVDSEKVRGFFLMALNLFLCDMHELTRVLILCFESRRHEPHTAMNLSLLVYEAVSWRFHGHTQKDQRNKLLFKYDRWGFHRFQLCDSAPTWTLVYFSDFSSRIYSIENNVLFCDNCLLLYGFWRCEYSRMLIPSVFFSKWRFFPI